MISTAKDSAQPAGKAVWPRRMGKNTGEAGTSLRSSSPTRPPKLPRGSSQQLTCVSADVQPWLMLSNVKVNEATVACSARSPARSWHSRHFIPSLAPLTALCRHYGHTLEVAAPNSKRTQGCKCSWRRGTKRMSTFSAPCGRKHCNSLSLKIVAFVVAAFLFCFTKSKISSLAFPGMGKELQVVNKI